MASKRASTTATARLKQDYIRIKKDPVPYITAEPLPSNILEWYLLLPLNPYSAGIDFSRHNLTSVDGRF